MNSKIDVQLNAIDLIDDQIEKLLKNGGPFDDNLVFLIGKKQGILWALKQQEYNQPIDLLKTWAEFVDETVARYERIQEKDE